MSKNILIVTGSIRKNNVGDKILELIKDELKSHKELATTVADLRVLDLPFFDSEHIPSSPSFSPTRKNVLAWTKLVEQADGVILLTPEYNRNLSAVQKNAIDWIYSQWENKPISLVGYGWSGAARSIEALEQTLPNLKVKLLPTVTNLRFTKQITTDGSIIDRDYVSSALQDTINELDDAISA